jgi:hypothetical protein
MLKPAWKEQREREIDELLKTYPYRDTLRNDRH